MKVCSNNRESLALLTLHDLEPMREHELRAHLESCEGCRSYFQQISNVTQTLDSIELNPQIDASERFHRKLVSRLKAEEPKPFSALFLGYFQNIRWNLGGASALLGVAVLAIVIALWTNKTPINYQPPTPKVSVLPAKPVKPSHIALEPSMSNYQMVANRSPEQLDQLLTVQAHQSGSGDAVYTASSTRVGNLLD
jgi:hypothetical protein